MLVGALPRSFGQSASVTGPRILLTWKSNTYVPEGFSGKIMPTSNSPITASVELIDGGKIIDLSRKNIYWYQDNNFLAGGIGMQRVTFRAPDLAGGTMDLRAEVPNYSKGNQLKTVQIPISKPEAVIEAPFPYGNFSSSPIKLVGQPYFFNADSVSQFNFAWSINGQKPSGAENPQTLNIKFSPTMPQGSTLSVSLSIQNTTNQYESGVENINLIYAP